MSEFNFNFENIGDRSSNVVAINHDRGIAELLRVSINDQDFSKCAQPQMPMHLADLIDLAIAVLAADRLTVRYRDISSNIHITLPTRQPSVLNQPTVQEMLEDTLWWYTGDRWSFNFVERTTYGRLAERQLSLDLSRNVPVEVALWSGGLDSLAGLCGRYLRNPNVRYVLFGTGNNRIIHKLQQTIASSIQQILVGEIELRRVPITVVHKNVYRHWSINKISRSRGFVFLLLGAVCALLENTCKLFVYENGIGALNLNYGAPEIGLDHSRAVHPLSLLRMSELVSTILGTRFDIFSPFMYSTKSEICRGLLELPDEKRKAMVELVGRTVSCDRRLRTDSGLLQCGCCSSCLLRRQALICAGVMEQPLYKIDRHEKPLEEAHVRHFQAMLIQVETIKKILAGRDPWMNLSIEYPELSDMVSETTRWHGIGPYETRTRLLEMYGHYVSDWKYVLSMGPGGPLYPLIARLSKTNLVDDWVKPLTAEVLHGN